MTNRDSFDRRPSSTLQQTQHKDMHQGRQNTKKLSYKKALAD